MQKHLLPWARLKFWRRRTQKIYETCPEIRWHLNEDARISFRNCLSLSLFALIFGWMWWLSIILKGLSDIIIFIAERLVPEWMLANTDQHKIVREANKILPAHIVLERIKE